MAKVGIYKPESGQSTMSRDWQPRLLRQLYVCKIRL